MDCFLESITVQLLPVHLTCVLQSVMLLLVESTDRTLSQWHSTLCSLLRVSYFQIVHPCYHPHSIKLIVNWFLFSVVTMADALGDIVATNNNTHLGIVGRDLEEIPQELHGRFGSAVESLDFSFNQISYVSISFPLSRSKC